MFANGTATRAINLLGTYDPTDFHAALTAGQTIVTYG
jgi:hypothetical protein